MPGDTEQGAVTAENYNQVGPGRKLSFAVAGKLQLTGQFRFTKDLLTAIFNQPVAEFDADFQGALIIAFNYYSDILHGRSSST
jgi:hypothetical protein